MKVPRNAASGPIQNREVVILKCFHNLFYQIAFGQWARNRAR